VISSSRKPLPDNTQLSQQTDIHASGGIRTNNFSRWAALDLRLRPRGHWDRRTLSYEINLLTSSSSRNIRRAKPSWVKQSWAKPSSGTAYTYSYEGGDGENTVLIPSYVVVRNLWPTNQNVNIDFALPPYGFSFYKNLILMKLEWSLFSNTEFQNRAVSFTGASGLTCWQKTEKYEG